MKLAQQSTLAQIHAHAARAITVAGGVPDADNVNECLLLACQMNWRMRANVLDYRGVAALADQQQLAAIVLMHVTPADARFAIEQAARLMDFEHFNN